MQVPPTKQTNRFYVVKHWMVLAVALYIGFGLTKCGPRKGEVAEAKRLASELKALAPAAFNLIHEEHELANQLKIMLDESAKLEPKQDPKLGATEMKPVNDTEGRPAPTILIVSTTILKARLTTYVNRLIAIRNERRQIRETVRQGAWESPMVFVVQHDAVRQLTAEIARSELWLELAENVRLRTELGRMGDFPELPKLLHELDSYLGVPLENPLGAQVRDLMEEYRFGETELKD